MRALVQRVTQASVTVESQMIGQIDQGLLVFICAEPKDGLATTRKMLDKVLKLRIFPDQDGKMNRSVLEVGGSLLVVSQFTLAADTSKGNRPSYTAAAEPRLAEDLYEAFLNDARQTGLKVASGRFGADMKVQLINDGPVTIPLSI
jgi:D-tyrosyl-tRNA(Tyr) deacylase